MCDHPAYRVESGVHFLYDLLDLGVMGSFHRKRGKRVKIVAIEKVVTEVVVISLANKLIIFFFVE